MEEDWPDFLKNYSEEIKTEAYAEFDTLARQLKLDIEKLKQEAIKQKINFDEHNKFFRTKKSFDYEGKLKVLDADAKVKAAIVAKKFDLKEEELSTKEKAAQFAENKKDTNPEKETLTREQKIAQMKDNLKSDKVQENDNNAEQEPSLSENKEEYKTNSNDITEPAAAETDARAKQLAELKSELERQREKDKER